MRDLERYTKATITKMSPPSAADLIELKKAQFVKSVTEQVEKTEDNQIFEATIGQMLAEGLTIDQVAVGLMKLAMGDSVKEMSEQNFSIDTYGNDRRREGGRDGGRGERGGRFERGERGERGGRFERGGERSERGGERRREFGNREGGSRDGGKRPERVREANMTRLFLNLGSKDRIRPNDIVGAIAGETGVPGRSIGGIDIYDNFSFVDVPSKDADQVINGMKNNTIKGKSVSMEVSKG